MFDCHGQMAMRLRVVGSQIFASLRLMLFALNRRKGKESNARGERRKGARKAGLVECFGQMAPRAAFGRLSSLCVLASYALCVESKEGKGINAKGERRRGARKTGLLNCCGVLPLAFK